MKILKAISALFLIGVLSLSCKNESGNKIDESEQLNTENVIPEDAKLETASLTIEGMTCEIGCAKAIESKLSSTTGVKEAKVDFEGKVAVVTFDSNQQDLTSLTTTIEAVAGGDSYKVTDSKLNVN